MSAMATGINTAYFECLPLQETSDCEEKLHEHSCICEENILNGFTDMTEQNQLRPYWEPKMLHGHKQTGCLADTCSGICGRQITKREDTCPADKVIDGAREPENLHSIDVYTEQCNLNDSFELIDATFRVADVNIQGKDDSFMKQNAKLEYEADDYTEEDFNDLDQGWAWVVLVATFFTSVLVGNGVYAVGILHSALLDRFRASVSLTSWTGGLHGSLYFLGGPLSTAMIDRYSCRTAIVLCGIFFIVGYFATAFAPTIEVAIFTYGIVAGIGGSFGYTADMVVIRLNFKKRRNLAIGIAISGVGAGVFALSPVTPFARDHYGNVGVFIFIAGIMADVVLFRVICFPSKLEKHMLLQRRVTGRGIGGSFGYTASMVVIGFYFKKRRNLAIGIAISGVGAGIFALSPVTQFARDHYGNVGVFIFIAGIMAHVVLFGVICFPSKLEKHILLQMRVTGRMSKEQSSWHIIDANLRPYLKVICNKGIICLSLGLFSFSLGTYLLFVHLQTYIVLKGFTYVQASMFFSLIGLVSIPCRVLTGMIADHVHPSIIYAGSFALAAIATFVYPFIAFHFAGQVIFMVAYGVLFGSGYVVTASMSLLFVDIKFLAAALGLQFLLGGVGSTIGPVLAGLIVDNGGAYDQSLFVAALCTLLAALFGGVSNCFLRPKTSSTLEVIYEPTNERHKAYKKADTSKRATTKHKLSNAKFSKMNCLK